MSISLSEACDATLGSWVQPAWSFIRSDIHAECTNLMADKEFGLAMRPYLRAGDSWYAWPDVNL